MADVHWFDKMSHYAQRDYIKKHPNSIYAKRVKRPPTAKESAAAKKIQDVHQAKVRARNAKRAEKLKEAEKKYLKLQDEYESHLDNAEMVRHDKDPSKYAAVQKKVGTSRTAADKAFKQGQKLYERMQPKSKPVDAAKIAARRKPNR